MEEFIFNCHTHIGDAFISLGKRKWTVEELVAPPDGFKYRLMRESRKEIIVKGMKKAVSVMKKSGITHFCDFREGGVEGINLLREVVRDREGISAVILGRPSELDYSRTEMDEILEIADGIGLSSISDWEYDELKKVAVHTHKRKKLFAIHASEAFREDIDAVLGLKPSFLVHMSSASNSDIELVADEGVPVVVCPRSNAFFSIRPNIEGMIGYGIPLLLGTDNAMITSPDITEEVEYLLKYFDVSREQAMEMITINPRKCLNVSADIHQSDGKDC